MIFFVTTAIIFIASIIGIAKLEVENSFINYFDKETEIYKGMKKIDENLGGTTPLNIIKISSKKIKKLRMMNFLSGKRKLKAMKIKQYWFTREKWIKSLKFMIT